MKIYLATPVNGRKEETLAEKQEAAMKRLDYIAELVKEFYPDAECINPVRKILTYHKGLMDRESTIMGTCVKMVMDSDMIVLDDGWMSSNGCKLERSAAFIYGKQIKTLSGLLIEEELGL